MAEANSTPSVLYHCFNCNQNVEADDDFTCKKCYSGCIEEIPNPSQHASHHQSVDERMHFDMIGGDSVHHLGDSLINMENLFPANHSMPWTTFRNTSGTDAENPSSVQMLIHQLFSNLGFQANAGNGGTMPNLQFGSFFGPNMNDYAWGPNGIDNIISQLLDQLENVGPPPAEESRIRTLPTEIINQGDLNMKSACPVCLDDYTVALEVKKLPCDHRFHPMCIETWLTKHDSCPVCRKSLDGHAPDPS